MPVIKVDAMSLPGAVLSLEKARRAAVIKAIQLTVQTWGPRLVQEEIDRTRPHKPVDTGDYRRHWMARKLSNGAVLANALPYAAIIEKGRRPGAKMPPPAALVGWVKRHGLAEGKGAARESAARGIAFVIARAIGQRGLPAKHVLRRARVLLDVVVKRAALAAAAGASPSQAVP